MTKHPAPITVFCRDADEALRLSAADPDSRATITGPGTLSFHCHLAEHGAGRFRTLYVPLALKGKFAPPVGGEVRMPPVARCPGCGITVFHSSDSDSALCSSCKRWA